MPREVRTRRPPYKVIRIICEGSKTERLYFEKLRQHKRSRTLLIKIPKTEKTDPVGLVRHAKNLIRDEEIDFKFGDQVWCVFDADKNTREQLEQAKKEAGKNIKLFLSNPSFEMWYLLHFEPFTDEISNDDLIKRLGRHIQDYKKNECYFDSLLNRQQAAIDNCKKLLAHHKANGIDDLYSLRSNPSSQIYELVEALKNLDI